jgi:hypothetical protein
MTRHEIVNSSRGWTIDGFRAFWAKPDISMVPAIRSTITSDIIGHWPRPIGDVRDIDLYLGVIADILDVCPDWSLAVPEYHSLDRNWNRSGRPLPIQRLRPRQDHGQRAGLRELYLLRLSLL